MSPQRALPLPFTGAFTAAEAHAAGITMRSLVHRVDRGEIVRLRRGVYTVVGNADPADVIRAALLTCRPGAIVGFAAAAVLHGLPTVGPRVLQRVDVYAAPDAIVSGGRPRIEVRVHHLPVPEAQVMQLDGVLVTSLARTAVDVSRGFDIARAVVALDAARRAGVRLRDLWDARHATHGQRGVAVLDEALRECTPKSESPLESISRLRFVRAGLPRPVLQREVEGASGRRYRVDFCWPKQRVIGEADGAVKYADRAAVLAEKKREDDLRAAGWTVVRWGWDDIIRTPDAIVARLRRALSGRRLP